MTRKSFRGRIIIRSWPSGLAIIDKNNYIFLPTEHQTKLKLRFYWLWETLRGENSSFDYVIVPETQKSFPPQVAEKLFSLRGHDSVDNENCN